MKTRNLFGMAFSLSILASCSQYTTTPLEIPLKNVVAAILPGDTVAYRLDSLIDFDWGRLIILTPYYAKQYLKDRCHIVSALPSSAIDNNEGPNEYIFIKEGKIVSHHISPEPNRSLIVTFGDGMGSDELISSCGIPNTSKTFVKSVSSHNREYQGKTFKIFLKE